MGGSNDRINIGLSPRHRENDPGAGGNCRGWAEVGSARRLVIRVNSRPFAVQNVTANVTGPISESPMFPRVVQGSLRCYGSGSPNKPSPSAALDLSDIFARFSEKSFRQMAEFHFSAPYINRGRRCPSSWRPDASHLCHQQNANSTISAPPQQK